MDAFEEPTDGVPLKLKFPNGLVRTRKCILSESIQVITFTASVLTSERLISDVRFCSEVALVKNMLIVVKSRLCSLL